MSENGKGSPNDNEYVRIRATLAEDAVATADGGDNGYTGPPEEGPEDSDAQEYTEAAPGAREPCI